MAPDHLAGVNEGALVSAGLAKFGLWSSRGVGQQRIQQRGLACTVAAHERDPFATGDTGGEVLNDLVLAVRLTQMFDFQNVFARRPLLLELDERALDVRLGQFGDLQPLDFLAA